MNLQGLVTITPDQTDLIDDVAAFMGKSFLEELWTATFYDALDTTAPDAETTAKRKLEASIASMRAEFSHGAHYACSYALSDRAGALLGYLGSELRATGKTWPQIEEDAHEELAREGFFTAAELEALAARSEAMEPISYFGWGDEESAEMGFDDYIYFAAWAVDPEKRGSGAFRRLTTPVFDFADERGIPCYLECYADHLISLYEHVGFEVFREFTAPGFDIVQTCMVRRPR